MEYTLPHCLAIIDQHCFSHINLQAEGLEFPDRVMSSTPVPEVAAARAEPSSHYDLH
jgi:hypothetical protein